MDMRLLVQKLGKLDAAEAVKFIDGCDRGKVALVHASLKDDVALLDFFQYLVDNLKTPFAGVRVSGSATPEGYVEDAIAIAVLCGDFEVKLFHEKIDFENPEDTAEKVIFKLDGAELCLVHSANYTKQNIYVDAILRRIQDAFPNMQMWGMASAPQPITTTNEGIYNDTLTFTIIKGINFSFNIESGFTLDENKTIGYEITKADEYCIYKINRKDAVEEYSKIQHMRPYFINTLFNLSSRPDVVKLLNILSQLNEVLYEAVIRSTIKPLGTTLDGETAEILLPFELDERNRRHIIVQSYKPEGTLLRHLTTSPENQLAVYDRLHKKNPKRKAILISSCTMRQLWFNFDYETLKQKIRKFNCPILVSFVFGEFGAALPHTKPEQNVVHGGVAKALTFK